VDLQLEYGALVVGDITGVFEHQRTWFGTFRPAFSAARGPVECRICEFIDFCKNFCARSAADQDTDAAEFDRFDDLLSSGPWRVRDPSGAIAEIKGAPNFLGGEEISWITVELCPMCGSYKVDEGFILGARDAPLYIPVYSVPPRTGHGLYWEAGVSTQAPFRACLACGHLWSSVSPDRLRAFIAGQRAAQAEERQSPEKWAKPRDELV
jgi:hypothetical protein